MTSEPTGKAALVMERQEEKRLESLLSGNQFSVLTLLQGAIRHLLWRTDADLSDFAAALRIERAQSDFLLETMNERFSSGYDAALDSRAEMTA
jgi:hypothetical protein